MCCRRGAAIAVDRRHDPSLTRASMFPLGCVHQASSQLQESISEDIDSVRRFLDAIEVIGELSPASEDFIIGTGEKLSAKILAAVFNHHVCMPSHCVCRGAQR